MTESGTNIHADTFTSAGAVTPGPSVSRSGLSAGAVIGIVVIVFIIFLIIVDVSCYFMNSCGVLHCCCVQLCGKGAAGSKEKAMEEGERCVGETLLFITCGFLENFDFLTCVFLENFDFLTCVFLENCDFLTCVFLENCDFLTSVCF